MYLFVKKRANKDEKTACVVRYGAYGDAIMVNPILKCLKDDGYHVTVNCTERTYAVLKHDPNIDQFLYQFTDEIPNDGKKLDKHWADLAKQFDKFINLTEVIEDKLLLSPQSKKFYLPKFVRHRLCNKNYIDAQLTFAGYPNRHGLLPSLYFKEKEEQWAKKLRKKHKGFLIVWCLSGSAFHKMYPYADMCIQALLQGIPEATCLVVGEEGCKGLVTPHERVIDACGSFAIRKSLILTKYADLVVSPETAVANAASCYKTPKVIFLSHSSHENLTKYWENVIPVTADVKCYPCHKLHYVRESCPINTETALPVCVSKTLPGKVLDAVEKFYKEWKQHGPANTADRHINKH